MSLSPSGYIGPPVTTHTWLRPLYRWLKGMGGVVLSPTGVVLDYQVGVTGAALGFYGNTGTLQPTGVGSTGGGSGGVTGTTFFDMRSNGGTGVNYYTFNDLVLDLKNQGLIAK